MDDELLKAFVEQRDERAFAQIVERYIQIVYASARRQVRDPHLAEDVTQAVFILLTQKARTIRGGKSLAGWLVRAAQLCARAAARSEARLKHREGKAAAMIS